MIMGALFTEKGNIYQYLHDTIMTSFTYEQRSLIQELLHEEWIYCDSQYLAQTVNLHCSSDDMVDYAESVSGQG